MILEQMELGELVQEVQEHIMINMFKANQSDILHSYLVDIGCEKFLSVQNPIKINNKDGKILVLGQSDVKVKQLVGIAKKLGFPESRFDFHLDYLDAEKLNVFKFQYNRNYCAILVGPVPHKVHDIGDYNSMIEMMENEPGYPPVKRLLNGQNLKISKTNFQEALIVLLEDGKIII